MDTLQVRINEIFSSAVKIAAEDNSSVFHAMPVFTDVLPVRTEEQAPPKPSRELLEKARALYSSRRRIMSDTAFIKGITDQISGTNSVMHDASSEVADELSLPYIPKKTQGPSTLGVQPRTPEAAKPAASPDAEAQPATANPLSDRAAGKQAKTPPGLGSVTERPAKEKRGVFGIKRGLGASKK